MSTTKSNEKQEPKKKSTLHRLVTANLVALLGLITLLTVVLFAFGLLDTIVAFIF